MVTGTAQMIGLQHMLTFDGRYLEFTGPCTYLLSRDFLTHHFTLAVHYLGTVSIQDPAERSC